MSGACRYLAGFMAVLASVSILTRQVDYAQAYAILGILWLLLGLAHRPTPQPDAHTSA